MTTRRFVPLTEVAEVLTISGHQARQLVLSGDLPAIKVGGRGAWRVDVADLEAYIARQFDETRRMVAAHRAGEAPADDL